MGQEQDAVHRQLDPGNEIPALEITRVVAELEGEQVDELAPIWGVIDDLLDGVFSNPPSPEAEVEVTFSYEGYRITVEQDGRATFVAVG